MGELLESFIAQFENDKLDLNLKELLSNDERIEWETLVKAFNEIEVMDIANTTKKIPKMYKLDRWQDMAILAYIKTLELMIMNVKNSGQMGDMPPEIGEHAPQQHDPYSGSMFG